VVHPPVGVAVRQSTDVLSVADREVAAAVRFIRENACPRGHRRRRPRSGLVVPLDPRAPVPGLPGTLSQSEIHAVRLTRAKQLLVETDHAIHRVAELVGFEHPEYFNVVFKREIGRTPGQFREQLARAPGRAMTAEPH